MSITFDPVHDNFGAGITDEQLDQKWVELAKVNLGEDPEKKVKMLEECRKKCYADERCEKFMTERFCLDDAYLMIFLRAGEWDLTKAMEIVQKFQDLGVNYKKYVEKSIPSKLTTVWEAKLNTVLQTRDRFGRRIVILNLGRWDPSAISVEEWFASTFVLLEVLTKEVKTQIAGITIILDCSGFGLTHIKSLGVNEIRLASAFLSGSFPLWTRRIHFVFQPRLFSVLMNVVRPFLTENAKDVLMFHGTDLDGLHKEVPKEVLPKELGGPLEYSNDDIVKAAKNMEDHFQELIQIALTL